MGIFNANVLENAMGEQQNINWSKGLNQMNGAEINDRYGHEGAISKKICIIYIFNMNQQESLNRVETTI